MVIAEKMQDSVNQKFIESALDAQAEILRFFSSSICGYYHVAQKMGGDMGKFTLTHGKGNDVCWTLAIEISVIEFCDLRIIHDKDGNFTIRTVQGA